MAAAEKELKNITHDGLTSPFFRVDPKARRRLLVWTLLIWGVVAIFFAFFLPDSDSENGDPSLFALSAAVQSLATIVALLFSAVLITGQLSSNFSTELVTMALSHWQTWGYFAGMILGIVFCLLFLIVESPMPLQKGALLFASLCLFLLPCYLVWLNYWLTPRYLGWRIRESVFRQLGPLKRGTTLPRAEGITKEIDLLNGIAVKLAERREWEYAYELMGYLADIFIETVTACREEVARIEGSEIVILPYLVESALTRVSNFGAEVRLAPEFAERQTKVILKTLIRLEVLHKGSAGEFSMRSLRLLTTPMLRFLETTLDAVVSMWPLEREDAVELLIRGSVTSIRKACTANCPEMARQLTSFLIHMSEKPEIARSERIQSLMVASLSTICKYVVESPLYLSHQKKIVKQAINRLGILYFTSHSGVSSAVIDRLLRFMTSLSRYSSKGFYREAGKKIFEFIYHEIETRNYAKAAKMIHVFGVATGESPLWFHSEALTAISELCLATRKACLGPLTAASTRTMEELEDKRGGTVALRSSMEFLSTLARQEPGKNRRVLIRRILDESLLLFSLAAFRETRIRSGLIPLQGYASAQAWLIYDRVSQGLTGSTLDIRAWLIAARLALGEDNFRRGIHLAASWQGRNSRTKRREKRAEFREILTEL